MGDIGLNKAIWGCMGIGRDKPIPPYLAPFRPIQPHLAPSSPIKGRGLVPLLRVADHILICGNEHFHAAILCSPFYRRI